MIIFGTRAYFRTKSVTQQGFCGHCNQFAKMRSYTAMNFFHLYFVPVIPISGRKRSHKMCSKCNHGREMTPDDLETLVNGLKERSADAVIAIQSGEPTFGEVDPQTGVADDCTEFLLGAFDWLYAAKETPFCEGIVQSLQGVDATYSREMCDASLATMKGKLDEAITHYEGAASARPGVHPPHALRAHLLVVRRRREEAIEAYQKALDLAEQPADRLGLLLQISEEYMAAKRFDDAVDSYEAALAISPSLAEDKAVARPLKKARKKSGRVA